LSPIFGFAFFTRAPLNLCHPERSLAIGETNRNAESRDLVFSDLEFPKTVFPKSPQKHEWRMPERACAAVFSLYIQNIKSKGGNRTFFRIYISRRVNGLEKNTLV
jgi:hypothetical protein